MKRFITIYGSDRASVNQNDVINGDRPISDEGSRLVLIA